MATIESLFTKAEVGKGEKMPDTVLYHAGCWDGFCAAWIAHQKFPDAE